jgi:hypothetical protein
MDDLIMMILHQSQRLVRSEIIRSLGVVNLKEWKKKGFGKH